MLIVLTSCFMGHSASAAPCFNQETDFIQATLAFYEDHLGCCSANAPRITIKDYLGESSIREIGDFLL